MAPREQNLGKTFFPQDDTGYRNPWEKDCRKTRNNYSVVLTGRWRNRCLQ